MTHTVITVPSGYGGLGGYPASGNGSVAGLEQYFVAPRTQLWSFSRYYDFDDALYPSSSDLVDCQAGRILNLCIASRLSGSGGAYVPWSSIASGSYDTQITALGNRLAAMNVPIILSIDNEFDGVARRGTTGSPGNGDLVSSTYCATYFEQAWMRYYNIIEPLCPLVTWAWVPSGNNTTVPINVGGTVTTKNLNVLFPSTPPDYVAWDPYDPTMVLGPLDTFTVKDGFYSWLQSQGWGLPMGLYETGTNATGSGSLTQEEWIEDMAAAALSANIKWVNWFSSNTSYCASQITSGGGATGWGVAGNQTFWNPVSGPPPPPPTPTSGTAFNNNFFGRI